MGGMGRYICTNCGEGTASWMGKCPSCGEWNTFEAQAETSDKKNRPVGEFKSVSFSSIQSLSNKRIPTGMFEFDRVLGGGLVKGEVILLTGEPGVGKSTLLLQGLKNLSTLYISGEESGEQVKERAVRLGMDLSRFLFSDSLELTSVIQGIEKLKEKPDIVVIDSVQTMYAQDVEALPGSVSQLREGSARLIQFAKKSAIPFIMVGHITKGGEIAGPKTLEHMVDAVLTFEGERVSHYRVLRAQKNRFGTTEEIGMFEMSTQGLVEINDPLAFTETHSKQVVPGKSLIGVMEGKRPLFFELQTLATPSFLPMPRRVVKGVDYNKLLLLLAVIEKHLRVSLGKLDIYMNVVGGIEIKSPATDLGIVASILSSAKNTPLPAHSLFVGEVGLLGEVRSVPGQDRILSESKRLRFSKAFSAQTTPSIRELASQIFEK